jgi:hypothetical protein
MALSMIKLGVLELLPVLLDLFILVQVLLAV